MGWCNHIQRVKYLPRFSGKLNNATKLGFVEFMYLSFLTNLNGVTILLTIDGSWDVGLAVMVKDIYEFYDLWNKVMQFRELIDDYHISIYSPIYHFTRKFLSPSKEEITSKTLILGGKDKVKFDELDVQILKELAPNVRKPLTEIANKLHKSSQLIINRIKSLEKRKIIQGYRPILNWNLLGYGYYKVDINLFSHKKYQDRFSDIFKNYTYFALIKSYKEIFFPV